MNLSNSKKNLLAIVICIALLVVCISASGCIFSSTDTPSVATPVVEKKDSFVGVWNMGLKTTEYDCSLEFKDEKSFVYTLKVNDEYSFNRDFEEVLGGLYLEEDNLLVEKGYLSKISEGKYGLMCTYVWLYDSYGEVIAESAAYPVESIGEIKYDKNTDKLSFEGVKFNRSD